jgi:hypothetical protein
MALDIDATAEPWCGHWREQGRIVKSFHHYLTLTSSSPPLNMTMHLSKSNLSLLIHCSLFFY